VTGARHRVVVRGARPADGARVASMVKALAASEGKAPGRFSAADFARDGFGPKSRFTCLVAARGPALLGYAIYYPAYDAATPSHGLHLLDLWVEPDSRDGGIGSDLIKEVVRRCRDVGGTASALSRHRGRGLHHPCRRVIVWTRPPTACVNPSSTPPSGDPLHGPHRHRRLSARDQHLRPAKSRLG
jgi:GNAT superfamily N-acetyltransferase